MYREKFACFVMRPKLEFPKAAFGPRNRGVLSTFGSFGRNAGCVRPLQPGAGRREACLEDGARRHESNFRNSHRSSRDLSLTKARYRAIGKLRSERAGASTANWAEMRSPWTSLQANGIPREDPIRKPDRADSRIECYFAVPSVRVSTRSTAGARKRSERPLGQRTTISAEVAAPSPK